MEKTKQTTKKQRFGIQVVKREKPKKSKDSKKKKTKTNDVNTELKAKAAVLITRSTVQEGMLIMGFVTRIEKTQLVVALPGRLRGTVQVTDISESYTKSLEKLMESGDKKTPVTQLEDLFVIGQTVCCKVTGFSKKSLCTLELSVNPKDIHEDITHTKLNEGMVLTGALASWEDHGAIIDMGISNLRCFLPRSPLTAGYEVGQLIQCRVDSITKTTSTANVTLSVATESKECEVTMESLEQVDRLLPNTQVRLTVLKTSMRGGISGKILDGQFDAFINENHLGAGKRPSDFKVGQDIVARVLYVMPLTKFVFLTLNKFVRPEKRLEEGIVLENVAVLNVATNAVTLKLNKNSVGVLSVKKMKTRESSLGELQQRYGSKVKMVRIVSYEPMDGIYVCTDDPGLVAEKFLKIGDLSVGQLVSCKVREPLNAQGILVKIGQLSGFIYKQQLDKTLAKCKPGATIKARVLKLDFAKNSVHLTTLPEFVKAEEKDLLLDASEAKVGQDYLGFVNNITHRWIFVEFFNKVIGTLKNQVTDNKTGYTIGSIYRFNVAGTTGDRLTLREYTQKASHRLGHIMKAKVISAFEDGLQLEVKGKKGQTDSVWVGKEFTTDFPELAPHMCLSYTNGEELQVVVVTNTTYSIRDVATYQRYPMWPASQLKRFTVLRGFIESVHEDGLRICIPLTSGVYSCRLPYAKVLTDEDVEQKSVLFSKNQVIYARVSHLIENSKIIPFTANLEHVFTNNVYGTVNYLKEYFVQLGKIHESMFKTNKFKWDIGSKIDGQVLEVVKPGEEYEVRREYFIEEDAV